MQSVKVRRRRKGCRLNARFWADGWFPHDVLQAAGEEFGEEFALDGRQETKVVELSGGEWAAAGQGRGLIPERENRPN